MSARGTMTLLFAGTVLLAAAGAGAQTREEIVERLPEVIPDPERQVDQVVEFGPGLGRYEFDGGPFNDHFDGGADGETQWFDSQFVRYSRTRPWLDSWRAEVGRQHRFGESSLDAGLSYTRFVRRTSFTAGISTGTGDVLAPDYRLDLGVMHPVHGFLVSLGYTRLVSKAENSSHGWSLGLTRWFGHLIFSAGHRIDFGQPGDTESSSTSFGVTYYVWRKTYLGVGADVGEVSYQLVGEDVPVSAGLLVDYDAWNWHATLSQYIDDRSGFNVRYDHGQALRNWDIDGVTLSYFREW